MIVTRCTKDKAVIHGSKKRGFVPNAKIHLETLYWQSVSVNFLLKIIFFLDIFIQMSCMHIIQFVISFINNKIIQY